MSKSDLQARIRAIHKKGQTGILRVRAPHWSDHDLFFMGGDLIACGSANDAALLGALLVAAGVVTEGDLAAVRDTLGEDQDLADELVHQGGVPGDAVMTARANLFSDNLAWAAIAPAPDIAFEGQDAVFPPNMQFGLALKDLLADLKKWMRSAAPVVAAMHDPTEFIASGACPTPLSADLWTALGTPNTIADVVALVGPPRREALVAVTGLLESSALVEVDDAPADTEDLSEEPDEDADLAIDLDESPDAAVDLPEDDEEADEPSDDEPKDQITEEDYERAARGEFIKSYDVLDKVDLSGVKVLGTDEARGSDESIPAIEAIGFDEEDLAIELGDMDSMDGIAALADEEIEAFEAAESPDTRPELAPVGPIAVQTDDIELLSDDFAMFDGGDEGEAPPVQDEAIEFEADEDVLSEEPLAAVILEEDEDAGATGTFNLDDDVGVFDREQLNDFHHRIDVFNNIFRIIFKSFAEHIGDEKSQQRFNALLGSSQRQYPELFQNLAVDTDGSIRPAPLINNLGNCPPGDYGSLLHQGLYELIFSHLYDAKDMLPGNAETEMMEQIVVFERQLHQM
jgi:hypothetical protein